MIITTIMGMDMATPTVRMPITAMAATPIMIMARMPVTMLTPAQRAAGTIICARPICMCWRMR